MRNTDLSCQANEGRPLDGKSRLPSSVRVVLPFVTLVKAMIMLAMYSSAAVLHPVCTEQAISLSSALLLAVSFVIMLIFRCEKKMKASSSRTVCCI